MDNKTAREIQTEKDISNLLSIPSGYVFVFLPEEECQITVSNYFLRRTGSIYVPFFINNLKFKLV